MAKAKKGDTVEVHYEGTTKDGVIFDSTKNKEPLRFTLGETDFFPAFEKEILGMQSGEKKSFVINSDDAYGPYKQSRVTKVQRDTFPKNLQMKVGKELRVGLDNETFTVARVMAIDKKNVTLDLNHPLAGKDLKFEVELVNIL